MSLKQTKFSGNKLKIILIKKCYKSSDNTKL